tara:strand:- start:1080 stop:1958 length:879 start_codon:yes stop_codon:yes gene_type:complete
MTYKEALIIGSAGMVGQAFSKVLKAKNINVITVARNNAEYCLDLNNLIQLPKIIKDSKVDLVINCAAIVSLQQCEENPILAKKINSDLVDVIGKSCWDYEKKFIQISTDHFYTDDKKKLHKESDEIKILNQYAKTKRLGEINALKNKDSLIIRTNVTGYRGNKLKPTFFEWLYFSLVRNLSISLFNDFYTSTIDSISLANYVIHSCEKDITGLINIASSECISKMDFALSLAKYLSINFDFYKESSVKGLRPQRAESLGLDCSKAELILNTKMPNTDEVIKNLVRSFEIKQN